MQIILLAAGRSTRMAPLPDKTLFKIAWKSIIENQINNIIEWWFKDFLIICNDSNINQIKNICNKKNGINFEYTIQEKLEDWMKWAIESCGKKVKDKVFIISSNDIVEKSVFVDMYKESQKLDVYWVVCGKVVEKYFPWGYISKDKNNNLVDIVEKPWEWKEPSNQINLVAHIWNDFWDFRKKINLFNNSTDDAYELSIQESCKTNKINVFEYDWFWQAAKYPWHFLMLNDYFLNKQDQYIHKNTSIADSAILKWWDIIIEEGVKIFENTIINWPVYIWKNTVIWNNCLIRWSSIWENCTIWFNTEVCRSVLQNDIWTHSNYIWDSVISNNVSFWAWTVTWNFRLDEEEITIEIKWEKVKTWINKIWCFIGENCRFWINTSINPWIKVWWDSMIWGWIILNENVEKKSFIYGKVEIIKKTNSKQIKKR